MTDEEILKMIEKYDTTDKLTWTDDGMPFPNKESEVGG